MIFQDASFTINHKYVARPTLQINFAINAGHIKKHPSKLKFHLKVNNNYSNSINRILKPFSTTYPLNLDDWLTMHRSITLVDLQLDAQNSYLFTYNTFIKILYIFRALPCSSSGGLRCNCIYAASDIITLCRWLSCAPVKKECFLNRCTGQSPAESDDTRGCIYTVTT